MLQKLVDVIRASALRTADAFHTLAVSDGVLYIVVCAVLLGSLGVIIGLVHEARSYRGQRNKRFIEIRGIAVSSVAHDSSGRELGKLRNISTKRLTSSNREAVTVIEARATKYIATRWILPVVEKDEEV